MSSDLTGGVAVVTGAGSGIGRALALRLAQEKMELALCDVNEYALAEAAKAARAQASGVEVSEHVVDVGDADQMRGFAEAVLATHGRATVLVNNAGVALHGRFDEIALRDIEWLMRINFWGAVNGCKIFLPILQREKRAHIVNLSSIFGIIAPAGQTAYSASKFAIRGFTEALRHELAGTNVGVTCVHPGGIRTRIAIDARMGEDVRDSRQNFAASFDRLARHSPEFAAVKIIAGVKKNKPRVLIGTEAYALDVIQRVAPASYGRFRGTGVRRRSPGEK